MANGKVLNVAVKKSTRRENFSDEYLNRIIEMGWEHRTTFEAEEQQFSINQNNTINCIANIYSF